MAAVMVVMSTYNGEKNIVKQLDSIFTQKDVDVSVYIRDDHSSDHTWDVINEYKSTHLKYNITVERGENLGFAKSFWTALKNCGTSEYYAFADQDDVWKKDKLWKSVIQMKDIDTPQLAYCKMQRSDRSLNRLNEQIEVLQPDRLTKKMTLTKTYNYGAATVINYSARELICRCWPSDKELPHDMWAGLLCYWFGKVYYIDEELYYWIRYDSSVTGKGTKRTGKIYRLRKTLEKKSYVNVSKELLEYYSDLLEDKDKIFLEKLSNYKFKKKDKIELLCDKEFRRDNLAGTLALKVGILLNWF